VYIILVLFRNFFEFQSFFLSSCFCIAEYEWLSLRLIKIEYTLIRLLLIFALIYLAIRLIGKALFPSSGRNYGRRRTEEGEREGDVTIRNKDNSTGKKISRDEGDYVDYEELK